jgi:branched-chain amino acid transport system permease protein
VSALLTLKLGCPSRPAWLPARRHRRGRRTGRADHGACAAIITAIVTLGFAETIRIVASNTIWLTNGTDRYPASQAVSLAAFARSVQPDLPGDCYRHRRGGLCHGGAASRIALRTGVARSATTNGSPPSPFYKHVAVQDQGVRDGAGPAGALYAHYTSYIAPDIFVPLLTSTS